MKTRYWTWLGWPLGAAPLAWLVLEAASGQLGPDPAEVFVERLGWWALVLLLTCLTMRPAAQLLRVPGLVVWRRTFGLWAFGYVSLHFLAWATLLLGWDPNYLGEELGKRPYIIVGLLGWLAMWPLAATSTRKARRRMGALAAGLAREQGPGASGSAVESMLAPPSRSDASEHRRRPRARARTLWCSPK